MPDGSEETILLRYTKRSPYAGAYVLARRPEWVAEDLDEVTGWFGPEKSVRRLSKSDLLEVRCRTVLISPDGEWDCVDALPDEELMETMEALSEEILTQLANERAAETWSNKDFIPEVRDEHVLYEDIWVLAKFGDSTAVNGELIIDAVPPPSGFIEWEGVGGRIPSEEEYVDRALAGEVLADAATEKIGKKVPRDFSNAALVESYGDRAEIPWGVSGETEVYIRAEVFGMTLEERRQRVRAIEGRARKRREGKRFREWRPED